MTEKEIEDKMFEKRMYISDKFRDIQMQAQGLKNVEDESRNLTTLIKICDFVDEIRREYDGLRSLSYEEPDEEEDIDYSAGFLSYPN